MLVPRSKLFITAVVFYSAVVKCGKPPTIVNGGPVMPSEEEYEYKSVVGYSCEKEFTLVGAKSIVCEKDGEFQPAPPECKSMLKACLFTPFCFKVIIMVVDKT